MKRSFTSFSSLPTLSRSLQHALRETQWLRYFFHKEDGFPHHHHEINLQRNASWIGFSLLLLSLNELLPFITSGEGTWLPSFLARVVILLHCLLTLGSFFTSWQALRPGEMAIQGEKPSLPRRGPRLLLAILFLLAAIGCVMSISTVVLCFLAPRFPNDGTSLDTNAAMLLLQGRNPYTDSSILDVARHFFISPDWTTPLRQGPFSHFLDYPSSSDIHVAFAQALRSGTAPEFESRVSYPALAFLSLVPFALFHHSNVLPLYLASHLLLVAMAWRCVQPALRPWLLVLAMANIPMWDSTLSGNLDIFCFLFITLAWLQRDHHWRSALFLGLAIASKQTAWLFVPFYGLLIWRSISLKDACLGLGIALGIFWLFNLPFFLWNPHAWLTGVFAPVADPMFPLGVGIISLSNAHLLPSLPGWFYWLLEGTAMLCALVWYQRRCLRYPEAAIILAVLPLFFAWRSLPSYFACTAFPLFVLLAARREHEGAFPGPLLPDEKPLAVFLKKNTSPIHSMQ